MYEYDGIHYYAKDIALKKSSTLNLGQNCNPGYNAEEVKFDVDAFNYGTFTIEVTLNDDSETTKSYSVSLNPSEKNYIYNVIGGEPEKGDAEIYVEELYDVALKKLIEKGEIVGISQSVTKFENVNNVPAFEDVYDILTDPLPTKNMLGRRYLYSTSESVNENGGKILVKYSKDNGMTWIDADGQNGMIYTVISAVDAETGKYSFFYGAYVDNIEFSEYTELEGTAVNETNGITWISNCEATSRYPMNMYGNAVIPSTPSIADPVYIKVGAGISKIISGTDFANMTDSKYICEYNSVTEANDSDYLVIEYSTPDDNESVITCEIFYDNTSLGDYSTIDEPGWRTAIPLDKTNSKSCFYNKEGINYTNPSLLRIEYKNVKIYKKQYTITDLNSKNHRTEQLTTFNYSEDVENNKFINCVRVVSENSFYINYDNDVVPVTLDFNNYKEQYRWASSPWVVSEIKGSANNIELNKLFRFHAISDGSNSTTEFKISIENIDPSTGNFDVVVRDYYDSDYSVNAYEKFTSCNLVPGSPNYISLKIGSSDGLYNSKSRYITVEVIENDVFKTQPPLT